MSAFVIIFFFGYSSFAVEPNLADKAKLAEELIQAQGFDQDLKQAFERADQMVDPNFFKKGSKFTLPMVTKAQKTFRATKENLEKESKAKLVLLLCQKFSAAELKYLTDLAKNSLNKKFHALIESDEFVGIIESPYQKVSEILNQAYVK